MELRSPSHLDRAVTIYNLADDLRRRFLVFGANAELDEVISLHRSALDLRPVGHPGQLLSASCLGLRFDKLEVPADLDDFIFDQAILEFHIRGRLWSRPSKA